MTYYTITTDHGEFSGLLVRGPNDILELFSFQADRAPAIIGIEDEARTTVYVRCADIRSVATWTSDEAEERAPAVGDSPSVDDAPRG